VAELVQQESEVIGRLELIAHDMHQAKDAANDVQNTLEAKQQAVAELVQQESEVIGRLELIDHEHIVLKNKYANKERTLQESIGTLQKIEAEAKQRGASQHLKLMETQRCFEEERERLTTVCVEMEHMTAVRTAFLGEMEAGTSKVQKELHTRWEDMQTNLIALQCQKKSLQLRADHLDSRLLAADEMYMQMEQLALAYGEPSCQGIDQVAVTSNVMPKLVPSVPPIATAPHSSNAEQDLETLHTQNHAGAALRALRTSNIFASSQQKANGVARATSESTCDIQLQQIDQALNKESQSLFYDWNQFEADKLKDNPALAPTGIDDHDRGNQFEELLQSSTARGVPNEVKSRFERIMKHLHLKHRKAPI